MSRIENAHNKTDLSYKHILDLGVKLAATEDIQTQKTILLAFLNQHFSGEFSIWLKYLLKNKKENLSQFSLPFDPYTIISDKTTEKKGLLTFEDENFYWSVVGLSSGNNDFGLIIAKHLSDYNNDILKNLQDIAAVAGLAIYGCLQTYLKNWRQTQLSLVRSVTAQISKITEFNSLTKTITDLVQMTFGFYYVAIFLINPESGRLHFKNSSGSDQSKRPEFENENHKGFALGEHIIGYVAETGTEVIANNVALEPRYQIVDSLAETKSEAVLPLIFEKGVLGVFDIQSDEFDAFDEDDLIVLRALADNIAIAIESTRLYQEVNDRAEQLAAVSEVSRAITFILDTEELLQKIVDLINERFNFPYVHIYAVDPVQKKLTFKAGAGKRTLLYKQANVSYDLDAEKGILTSAVQQKKTFRVNNVSIEPQFLKSPFAQDFAGSEMAVPLVFGGDVLGVLDIQSEKEQAFSHEDQQLMETLADNMAIAIRNARLYRSEKWRRQVAESLRDVAGLLSENADLQKVMSMILVQLNKNLPCDVAGIWLFNQDQKRDLSDGFPEMNLAAFYTSEEYQQSELGQISLQPDEWVKNALKQKLPTIRQPEDPIGPVGQHFNLDSNYSSIAAPLHTGDEILGMLILIHHTPNRYGAESQKITSAFASYAAVAIENNRLYQTSQEQAWISTILLQVAQATQSLTNLDELVETIVRITPMVAGIKGCALFLREPNSNIYSLNNLYGIEFQPKESSIKLPYPVLNPPALQNLEANQQPIIIDAPVKDLNLPEELAAGMKENALILLPIISRKDLLGAFLLANEKQDNSYDNRSHLFGDEQLKIVLGIIQQTAVAIENIRLIEDKQEEAYVSTVLLQSAQAIVSGGTLSDTLESIVNILPILIGIDSSAIYLWDQDEKLFEISHVISNDIAGNEEIIGTKIPPGDFPMLDAIFKNKHPLVYPFIENVFPIDDWDLALPDEEQIDPNPILKMRYPLLLGYPLSVKDEVFGVLLAQDNNFATNRVRRFELLYGIAQQVSLAIQNDILNKEMLDRQRLEREFQLAREIQQTFLPDEMPEMPGWEMAVHWETARQVGGDFYDYFILPDGRLAIVIADVSDKGLAASLYMTVTRTLLRAAALEAGSPAKTLERVNELLLANSQNGLFVTAFYGILSLEDGLLSYTIAGHNPPMIVSYENEKILELDKGGIALGALPEISLDDNHLELKKGDCLVLYTDGVTEAFSHDDHMYGDNSLKQILRQSIGMNARLTLEKIEIDLEDFRGNAPLSDDTTILAICRSLSLANKNGNTSTA